ncbi:AB hydrolase-1 domain-containing protein [Mycena kentingensis (nom. inval.)]|nr:AB hydrolase-1 domain-containing protein [Mycena kentingensis (nom. inval.)]
MLDVASSPFECPQNIRDPPGVRLKLAVKRYTTRDAAPPDDGLTLLLGHCIGAHKEQWEPTIERIFALRRGLVHEAYAVDWQTHGDAALLNRDILESSPGRVDGVSAAEWGEAIGAFVRSSSMRGKRIVGIGHSASCSALVHSSEYQFTSSTPKIPYCAFILIEPTSIPHDLYYRDLDTRMSQMEFVVSATLRRRETWASREEAFAWMRKRVPWSVWDERVLRRLVDHGLGPDPSGPAGSVRVKADRRYEALSYTDTRPHFDAPTIIERLGSGSSASESTPVHFVWAEVGELIPLFVQEYFASPGAGGASTSKVAGGHMLVQENPDGLAERICGILDDVCELQARGKGRGEERSTAVALR